MATPTQIRRRGRLSLILGTLVAALLVVAVAYADTVFVNDSVAGSTATKIRTGTGTADVRLLALNDSNGTHVGDRNGCNAGGGGSAVSIALNAPTGITFATNPLTFTDCDLPETTTVVENGQSVNYTVGTSTPLGANSIATTTTGGKDNSLFNEGGFTINVNPRAASNLAATAVSASQIDLSWTASPDAADITKYVIAIAQTGGSSDTLDAAKNATSLNVTGLSPNTEYCFTIKARYTDASTNNFDSAVEPSSGSVCATTLPAVTYAIDGFYQPVQNKIANGAKAGATIPIKFNVLLDGIVQTDTSLVTSLVQKHACESGTEVDMLTTDELSSGNTSLRFDSVAQQMIFNWKTSKTTGCYRITLTVQGGAFLSAEFQLR